MKDQQFPAGDPRRLTTKGWNFESLDFYSTPVVASKCSSRMASVYRAYNNGFARGIDSNHRITTNRAATTALVAKGWKDEGGVMCAPLTSVFDPAAFIATGGSSAVSSANGFILSASFSLSITNTSTETFLLKKAELTASTTILGTETRASLLGNGDLAPGESVSLTFSIRNVAGSVFRFAYYLTDPVTAKDFMAYRDFFRRKIVAPLSRNKAIPGILGAAVLGDAYRLWTEADRAVNPNVPTARDDHCGRCGENAYSELDYTTSWRRQVARTGPARSNQVSPNRSR